MDEAQQTQDAKDTEVSIAPFLVVSRHPDGVRFEGSMSSFEAPTILRLAALEIERQLGIRE